MAAWSMEAHRGGLLSSSGSFYPQLLLQALGGSNCNSALGAGVIWVVPQPVETWHLRDHSLPPLAVQTGPVILRECHLRVLTSKTLSQHLPWNPGPRRLSHSL